MLNMELKQGFIPQFRPCGHAVSLGKHEEDERTVSMMVDVAASDDFSGLTVADVMLRRPKTLPTSATVGDVRSMLRNPSVQMVLIADRGRFCGAVTEIPEDARDDEQAISYADRHPESLPATESARTAFEVTARRPDRRVVVLDERSALLGLLCLDASRTRFCGGAHGAPE